MKALRKSMRESVAHLRRDMLTHPQLDLSAHTSHFFADGMYCRPLWRPKDCLIVGKVHKREHFYIVAKGSVQVTNGDERAVIYEAGSVIVSKPGTERAVLALEDSICLTVHQNPTGGTDIAEIEDALVEPNDESPFGPGNVLCFDKLKELA